MNRIHRSAVAGAIGVLGLASLLAQSNPPATDLPGVLPADGSTESFVLTPDGQRTYYVNTTGEIWVFDRAQKTTARIATGRAWDLAVAPTRDALVYTRAGRPPRRSRHCTRALSFDRGPLHDANNKTFPLPWWFLSE